MRDGAGLGVGLSRFFSAASPARRGSHPPGREPSGRWPESAVAQPRESRRVAPSHGDGSGGGEQRAEAQKRLRWHLRGPHPLAMTRRYVKVPSRSPIGLSWMYARIRSSAGSWRTKWSKPSVCQTEPETPRKIDLLGGPHLPTPQDRLHRVLAKRRHERVDVIGHHHVVAEFVAVALEVVQRLEQDLTELRDGQEAAAESLVEQLLEPLGETLVVLTPQLRGKLHEPVTPGRMIEGEAMVSQPSAALVLPTLSLLLRK